MLKTNKSWDFPETWKRHNFIKHAKNVSALNVSGKEFVPPTPKKQQQTVFRLSTTKSRKFIIHIIFSIPCDAVLTKEWSKKLITVLCNKLIELVLYSDSAGQLLEDSLTDFLMKGCNYYSQFWFEQKNVSYPLK